MIRFEILGRRPSSLRVSDLKRIADNASVFLKFRKPQQVSLSFVSETKMRSLNRQYMKKNCPTDVLSFAAAPKKDFPSVASEQVLGDLFICPSYAATEAKRRSVPVAEELSRLIIHGILHLAGYDHAKPAEEARMFRTQERLVEASSRL